MMSSMRTTLAIDDDLAGLLKRRARELGVPFKDVVNQTSAPVSASRQRGVGERRQKSFRIRSVSGPALISTSSTNCWTNSKPKPTRRGQQGKPRERLVASYD